MEVERKGTSFGGGAHCLLGVVGGPLGVGGSRGYQRRLGSKAVQLIAYPLLVLFLRFYYEERPSNGKDLMFRLEDKYRHFKYFSGNTPHPTTTKGSSCINRVLIGRAYVGAVLE